MPKVSVIIPIYNVEVYLGECLDSIVAQTLNDIEIICVDDGSPDNSRQIVKEYAKKFQNIKLICKENGGLSSARNAGLEVATGTYVYFLDSDDYIEKETLEQLYLRAELDDLEVVYFNTIPFFESEEVKIKNANYIKFYKREGVYSGVYSGQKMFKIMCQNHEFLGNVALEFFRRSFVEKHHLRFFEEIIHEDNLFTFQCSILATKVGYLNKEFHHRRVHDESIMTVDKSMKNVEGYLISYAEMLAFLHGKFIEEESAPYITEYLHEVIYRCGYNIYNTLNIKSEDAFLSTGGYYETYFFEMLKKDIQREKEFKKLKQENMNLNKYIKNVKLSSSYRMGNFITFIPRKIKGGIQCAKEHGMKYTVRLLFTKIKKKCKRFI